MTDCGVNSGSSNGLIIHNKCNNVIVVFTYCKKMVFEKKIRKDVGVYPNNNFGIITEMRMQTKIGFSIPNNYLLSN